MKRRQMLITRDHGRDGAQRPRPPMSRLLVRIARGAHLRPRLLLPERFERRDSSGIVGEGCRQLPQTVGEQPAPS